MIGPMPQVIPSWDQEITKDRIGKYEGGDKNFKVDDRVKNYLDPRERRVALDLRSPDANPSLDDTWNYVTIAGERFPGLANLSGKVERRFDNIKVKGRSGTTYKYVGFEPSQLELTLRLWTDEHFQAFFRLVRSHIKSPRISFMDTRPPDAVEIKHPILDVFMTNFFIIKSCSFPMPNSQGIADVRIECFEFDVYQIREGATGSPQKSVGGTSIEGTKTAIPTGPPDSVRPSTNGELGPGVKKP